MDFRFIRKTSKSILFETWIMGRILFTFTLNKPKMKFVCYFQPIYPFFPSSPCNRLRQRYVHTQHAHNGVFVFVFVRAGNKRFSTKTDMTIKSLFNNFVFVFSLRNTNIYTAEWLIVMFRIVFGYYFWMKSASDILWNTKWIYKDNESTSINSTPTNCNKYLSQTKRKNDELNGDQFLASDK